MDEPIDAPMYTSLSNMVIPTQVTSVASPAKQPAPQPEAPQPTSHLVSEIEEILRGWVYSAPEVHVHDTRGEIHDFDTFASVASSLENAWQPLRGANGDFAAKVHNGQFEFRASLSGGSYALTLRRLS